MPKTRYVLWYLKRLGKQELSCACDIIFTEMKEALKHGEKLYNNNECLDYNVSIVYAPQLIADSKLKAMA